MKRCYVKVFLSITLTFSTFTLPMCIAAKSLMLFKFGLVRTHYENYAEKEYSIDTDLLNRLRLHDRRTICDLVANAKQFTHVYYPKYYDQHEKNPFISLQKHAGDPNFSSTSKLKTRECLIRLSTGFQSTKCLPCVIAKNLVRFVALSPVNRFIWYLLEPSTYDDKPHFRITGLFEPVSVKDEDVSFSYFYDQFSNFKSKMETICEMGQDDRLRLCSAVFEAVDDEKILQEINYVKVYRRSRKCFVEEENSFTKVDVLSCSMSSDDRVNKESTLMPFYLLADSSEPGAVFVFHSYSKRQGLPILKLYTRVTKLSALLHPIGMNRKTIFKEDEEDENFSKNAKKVKKRPRKKKRVLEDSDTEIDIEQIFDSDSMSDHYEEYKTCSTDKGKRKVELNKGSVDFKETATETVREELLIGGRTESTDFHDATDEETFPETTTSERRGKRGKSIMRNENQIISISEKSDKTITDTSYDMRKRRSKRRRFFIEDE